MTCLEEKPINQRIGTAIKDARKTYGESRKDACDALHISPRYLANIENKGQLPSLHLFLVLAQRYNISVDHLIFSESSQNKSTTRRQLDSVLDNLDENAIKVLLSAAETLYSVQNSGK